MHAFPALHWARCRRTGSAVVRAFCVLGRCFVQQRRGESETRTEGSAGPQKSNRRRQAGGRVDLRALRKGPDCEHIAGVTSGLLHRASSASGRELTQQMGQCRGRTHVPMALCEPRRQRPCHRDRDEQASLTDTSLAHFTGAWKCECERSAGGSLRQTGMAEGNVGGLGARYAFLKALA